jgi:rRNA maturation RNase YbeY
LGAAPSSVDLHFATTPEMVELNQVYRSKKGPTDVLSFPAPAPFRKQGHLGEIVICRSVMVKQAKELGHRPSFELDALLVHGLLHLLGFDHEEGTAEAKKMAEWEVRLLGTHARGAKAGSKLGLISRVNRGNSKP